jgi:hypothetical protein
MSHFYKPASDRRRYNAAMFPRWMTAVAVIAAFATTVSGRQRPDFSGTWSATTEAPKSVAAAPGAIMGQRFALRQDGNRLVVSRAVQDDVLEVTFPLDGSRVSYNARARSCEGDREITETVAWEGDALVITVVRQVPPGGATPLDLNVKRILRRDGDTLVVEGTRVEAKVATQVATVYRRQAEPMPAPKAGINVTPLPATIARVGWIAGTWIGTTGTVTTEERWMTPASGAMPALARTLRGAQMASWEFLCITERAGSLVYRAMPDGRTTPTDFMLTAMTADSATFENPGHDYPKLIRYSLKADGTLETTIGGAANGRTQSVALKRQP